MSSVSLRTRHKAQVYDVALNAFFKVQAFDSESLNASKTEVGWDVAEAMITAAVSGVTYKSHDPTVRTNAAMLLRRIADQVDADGLASVEWNYAGDLLSRHAWRPDLRTAQGVDDLDRRTDAIIEGLMRPVQALTVREKRATVCLSFIRMAVAHVTDLMTEEPQEAEEIRAAALATLVACRDWVAGNNENSA